MAVVWVWKMALIVSWCKIFVYWGEDDSLVGNLGAQIEHPVKLESFIECLSDPPGGLIGIWVWETKRNLRTVYKSQRTDKISLSLSRRCDLHG